MRLENFDSAVRPIRQKIMLFDTVSLFDELLRYLGQTPEMKENGQIAAPWVVLLAIDWVLELHPYSGKMRATQRDVQWVLNRIWRTQHIAVGVDTSPLSVQIRALVAPQITFQKSSRGMIYFFLRMKKIIAADSNQETTFKSSFRKRHGIEFETFYELTFILCIYCMTKKTEIFSYSVLAENLTPHYPVDDVIKAVNILSCTLSELVKKASREPERAIHNNEYFKESLFLDSPLLLTRKGILVVHPTVVMIGISESIVRCFLKDQQSNRTVFTRCFEEYINQIHQEFSILYLREDELQKFYAHNNIRDRMVIDFLVLEKNANIFIDAKGVDPTNPVLSATSRYVISRRIEDHHVKAIRQIIDTIDILSSNNFDKITSIENRFGLVITHQDFFLGTGDRILSFLHDSIRSELEILAKDKLHFSNIHFMTIDQYEKLHRVVSESEANLVDFFSFVKESELEPVTMKMTMDMYIESFCKKVFGRNHFPDGSASVVAEKERMFEIALNALSHNKNYWKDIGKQGDLGINHFLNIRQRIFDETYLARAIEPPPAI
ncbi:GapS1 family protein [Rheinheimera fenheensis]|uniref:GapS1 family protein n=1 Tax=Rheinheimera fenheensis TaxID=3152295 RepID=UPI00325F2A4B